MNPNAIRRRPFGGARPVCCLWAAAMILSLVAPVARSTESSTTNATVAARPAAPAVWKLLAEGGTDADLSNDPAAAAPDNTHAHPLRLTIRLHDGVVGLIESIPGQTNIAAGQWYDLVFQAKTQNGKHFAFTVSLEGDGGIVCARTTLPEVGGNEWRKYVVSLNTRLSAKRARVVITLAEAGTVWFDDLALVLRQEAKPEKPVEAGGLNP